MSSLPFLALAKTPKHTVKRIYVWKPPESWKSNALNEMGKIGVVPSYSVLTKTKQATRKWHGLCWKFFVRIKFSFPRVHGKRAALGIVYELLWKRERKTMVMRRRSWFPGFNKHRAILLMRRSSSLEKIPQKHQMCGSLVPWLKHPKKKPVKLEKCQMYVRKAGT